MKTIIVSIVAIIGLAMGGEAAQKVLVLVPNAHGQYTALYRSVEVEPTIALNTGNAGLGYRRAEPTIALNTGNAGLGYRRVEPTIALYTGSAGLGYHRVVPTIALNVENAAQGNNIAVTRPLPELTVTVTTKSTRRGEQTVIQYWK